MHVIPARRVAVSRVPPPDPVETAIRRLERGESPVRCITELAEGRSGCVARRELLLLETRAAIDWLVRSGRLIPWHRGVYAWGHRPRTYRAAWWAAVLAGGEDAKCSFGTAAASIALLRPGSRVHITTPHDRRRRPGIASHHAQTETVWVDGLPCTSVARTLVDLAGGVPQRVLESAVRQAQVRGLLDLEAIGEVVMDNPRPRGIRRLRAILEDPVALAPTKSEEERRAIRACLRAGLPWPVVNGFVLGEEVDLHWPDLRLILEIDGPTHDTPVQRARDRRRDAKLRAAGWTVVRIPAGEIETAIDRLWRGESPSRRGAA